MSWAFLHHDGEYGFAHRGGDEHAPENTMAAFQHAVDQGFRYLETDVHLTRDDVLVAFHDRGLDRVAGLSGTISDHSWDELSRIDLGDGHRIPRLDDLFASFAQAHFNIEPKSDSAVTPLARAIKAHGAVDRVCVGSFKDRRVRTIRELVGPDLCTSPGPWGLLRLGVRSLAGRRLPVRSDHGAVQVPARIGPVPLTSAQVDRYHEIGLQVHVWTINDPDEMHRLFDSGVDAIMSDRIGVLRRVLEERGSWR